MQNFRNSYFPNIKTKSGDISPLVNEDIISHHSETARWVSPFLSGGRRGVGVLFLFLFLGGGLYCSLYLYPNQ